jgi:hypothetical protein
MEMQLKKTHPTAEIMARIIRPLAALDDSPASVAAMA